MMYQDVACFNFAAYYCCIYIFSPDINCKYNPLVFFFLLVDNENLLRRRQKRYRGPARGTPSNYNPMVLEAMIGFLIFLITTPTIQFFFFNCSNHYLLPQKKKINKNNTTLMYLLLKSLMELVI